MTLRISTGCSTIGCMGVKWPSLRIRVKAGSCTVNVLLERLAVGLCVSIV